MINWLERYEEQTGGDVLAIAHNGNLSNGIMFPLEAQYDGRRFDTDYVTNRIKWEPLWNSDPRQGPHVHAGTGLHVPDLVQPLNANHSFNSLLTTSVRAASGDSKAFRTGSCPRPCSSPPQQ